MVSICSLRHTSPAVGASLRNGMLAALAVSLVWCTTVPVVPGGETPMPAADFFVSPVGNDAWSGRLAATNATGTDGPFASLARARDAVRREGGRDVTVLLRGGTYRVTETVVFDLRDSAGTDRSITYAAYPGETPVLTAAVPVTGWRPAPEAGFGAARGKLWVADVSGHPAMRPPGDGRSPRFLTLYRGPRRLARARGTGFSPVNRVERGQPDDGSTLRYPPGALPAYRDLDGAELRIIPSFFWIMNLLPVLAIDPATQTLRTSQPGTYPLGANGMTDRPTAWVENALEDLHTPGEWVLDTRNARLFHWPEEGTPGEDIAAPVLTEMVRVEGRVDYDGPEDTPVRGLSFRGLTFTQGDRYPWHGRSGWGLQHDWECFDRPTALLRLRGAENCRIEDCTFEHSGHTALRLDLHCRDNTLVGNHIRHLGGVGVLLAGYGPGSKDVNRRNTLANNYIHHTGEELWGAPAVFLWQSGENRLAHNHIHHTPYTAICVTGRISWHPRGEGECARTVRWAELGIDPAQGVPRWTWHEREKFLHGRGNTVEYNDIHHAMEVTGDGNAIYISGTGGGNVVQRNYCHDCFGRYMNAVIRCDDDQHETLMQYNVCCRTHGYGEGFISKGRNDIVNNVVADLRPTNRHRGHIVFPYGSVKGSRIERNILYSRIRGQKLYGQGMGGRGGPPPLLRDALADHNLYACTADPEWGASHLPAERAFGIELHSAVGDPGFADLDAGDVTFPPDSPAAGLGIEPIDTAPMGLEPAYRARLIGPRMTTRIRPSGCLLREPTPVTISASEPQAQIHYTLDGAEPTTDSPVYRGPLNVTGPVMVRARAFATSAVDLAGASELYTAPPPPLREDFETCRPGAKTPGAETQEDTQRPEFMARVSAEQAATGRHSLKFVDGPGQQHPFNPHVFYRSTRDDGRIRGGFDVRIDAATSMLYQWRQYDRGFVRGPSVQILPGGRVMHGEKELAAIPVDTWVHIEVACTLGEDGPRSFVLTLRIPGQPDRQVESLPCDPEFRRLDWVGFVANGEDKTVFYVDNITLD
ncbi:MAG: right-handed parallel beta-helix repeat-containing protein [Lentisphaeria bacterium]|nr:right-handed parallel beta-helix repeat-containing protein [Lentisphaeria bacterium]